MKDALKGIFRAIQRPTPMPGDVWWMRDAHSGVVHANPRVKAHPALVIRGCRSPLGEVVATVGSSKRSTFVGPSAAIVQVERADLEPPPQECITVTTWFEIPSAIVLPAEGLSRRCGCVRTKLDEVLRAIAAAGIGLPSWR
jgi:hypothetical protein